MSPPLPGPVGVEELAARPVDALVGVGAKVVALGLEQVGRQPRVAIAVVVGQGAAKGRHRDAVGHRGRDHAAPGGLAAVDGVLEVGRQQQVGQVGVVVEGLLDVAPGTGRG